MTEPALPTLPSETDAPASSGRARKLISYLLIFALLTSAGLGYYYMRFFARPAPAGQLTIAAAGKIEPEPAPAPVAAEETSQENFTVTEHPVETATTIVEGTPPETPSEETAEATAPATSAPVRESESAHRFQQLTALWRLKEKIQAGEEYRQELIAFKKLLRPGDEARHTESRHTELWDAATLLDAASREGYVSPSLLRQQLLDLSPALATFYRYGQPHNQRWLRLWLARWVHVMPLNATHAANDVETLLLKCDTALAQGETIVARNYANQLETSLAELPEDARASFTEWLTNLRQRVEADETLDRLFDLLQESR